jgi:ABC-type multidrug transport system fused ATPase/permease subunit
VTPVSQTDEARVRPRARKALIRDCTNAALAHGDAVQHMAEESELAVSERAAWWPNPGEDPLGEFAGVTVSYSGVPAVCDVAFPVPAGEIVALIGPSARARAR